MITDEQGWKLLTAARPTHDRVLEAALGEAQKTAELAPIVEALEHPTTNAR